MAPLVSIVIPCCNAGRMLVPALRSALAQTYPNLEIVFVDNNSTDGSGTRAREVAAQSPRPVTVLDCAAQGANHARNFGYAQISGDYVQWFDADDLLEPDKIERQVAFLERNKSVDIAYCDWTLRRALKPGEALNMPFPLADESDQLLRVLAHVWYPPLAYLFRRAAADRLQREEAWWPGRPLGTDIEYSAVAALLGLGFRHVPGAAVIYNDWSAGQMSGPGKPYAVKAAAFAEIYRRLAALAERADIAPRVAARHRLFLRQDWTVWSVPRGSLELVRTGGRRVVVRHRASGRALELRPREAAVVETVMQAGGALAIVHHAKDVASRLTDTLGDLVFYVETLDRLRQAGLLTRADEAAAPPR